MARQEVVSYSITCDVCGDAIPDSDAEGATRKFSWEGAEYEVDVCLRHQGELSEVFDQLKPFADAGTLATAAGRSRATRAPASRPKTRGAARRGPKSDGRDGSSKDVAAIRAWAQQNGHSVGDRGRIPARVVDAYRQSGAAGAEAPPAKVRRGRKAAAAVES